LAASVPISFVIRAGLWTPVSIFTPGPCASSSSSAGALNLAAIAARNRATRPPSSASRAIG